MSRHPSKDIVETQGKELSGKRIVLCVTGSVAAVQSPEIARGLMRHGADVSVAMSPMAQKVIHPYLMEWATGNPVVTELTGKIEHVAMVVEHSLKADLILVAPATANTISKIACGIDDTVVTSVASTAFGSKCPIVVVPAMHESMYHHSILAENIKKLEGLGVQFIGPRIDEGKAKIAETKEIVNAVLRRLAKEKDFSGRRVLVTAGATVEYIDPVRVLTNKSSGKMGIAVAEEALSRGAEVTLICGLGSAIAPVRADLISVETTEQMHEAVLSELGSKEYDVAIAAAAPADWTPEKTYSYKLSTHKLNSLSLKLKPTAKIIESVKKVSPGTYLVAFRAEYKMPKKELIESAYKRLTEAKADLIVVNDLGKKGAGFGTDTNEVFILDKKKETLHVRLTQKREVAGKILDIVSQKIKPK